jgi:hypothetical protein
MQDASVVSARDRPPANWYWAEPAARAGPSFSPAAGPVQCGRHGIVQHKAVPGYLRDYPTAGPPEETGTGRKLDHQFCLSAKDIELSELN